MRPAIPILSMAMLALAGAASSAWAEPFRVTGGFIQIWLDSPYFLIDTEIGSFTGERETGAAAPVMLSGTSGDVVNLSSSYSGDLTGFTTPDGVDHLGRARAELVFTAGDAVVPPLDDVLASRNGVDVFAPFTFAGVFTLFATVADMEANANAIARYELYGEGTARATFQVQTTSEGERQPDLPLVSYSVLNDFDTDPAPVPEPGTLLLLAGGLAATAARTRRGRARPASGAPAGPGFDRR